MVSEFPRYNSKYAYKKEAKAFETVMDVIKAVRNIKTQVNCPPAKKVKLFLATPNKRLISANANSILKLAGASEIAFVESGAEIGEKTLSQVTEGCTVFVPLGELVDIEKERERLSKELERVRHRRNPPRRRQAAEPRLYRQGAQKPRRGGAREARKIYRNEGENRAADCGARRIISHIRKCTGKSAQADFFVAEKLFFLIDETFTL